MIRRRVFRLGEFRIGLPAFRPASGPGALAEDTASLDLVKKLRRQEQVVDLVSGVAKTEGPRKAAVIERGMRKGILQRALLQRRQRGAIRRVVEVADQCDVVESFRETLLVDLARPLRLRVPASIGGLSAAETLALEMIDHDKQRRSPGVVT